MDIIYEKYKELKDEVNDLHRKYTVDAGYDLQTFGIEESINKTDHVPRLIPHNMPYLMYAGISYKIFCGVRLCIPPGYFGLLVPRSSARRKGLIVLSVWDSEFTGWLNPYVQSAKSFYVERGERLIQLLVLPVISYQFQEGEMPDTERGSQGDGSTGRF